jgi:hypothetical protein
MKMHKGSLFLLYIDILWVPPQHKQRDGAYPYVPMDVAEVCCVVIGSIEEFAVGFGQEAIA